MNKVPVIIFLLLFLGINSIQAQSRDRLRIMTYNVENLFDTLHAVGKSDTEFTPQGEHHWNAHHYWRKLVRIGSVIAAAGGSSPVDIVALAEVENDSVLYDLTKRTKLHKIGYEFIITHANNARGINVALMYLPYRFRPFVKDTLRIAPPAGHKPRQTRDVLHVAGQVTSGDTLDVIVCHLPSQRGGRPAQRYRLSVAKAMRHLVDSLAAMRLHPQIVITGDFNTSYPSAVFDEGLHVCLPHTASAHAASTNQLYLLTHNMKGRNDVAGTYKYQGEWSQLDHFIVNAPLLHATRPDALHIEQSSCKLADFPFLLKPDKKGNGTHPFRTYLGNFHQGGFSDHLPVLLDLYY